MTAARTIAILGGSLAGNKGAAAMVLSVVDGVGGRLDEARFVLFSPFPRRDRALEPPFDVVDFRPVDMILRVLPAALFSLLTFRRWRPGRGPAHTLSQCDVVADVSGIAFVDGRGISILIYNVLLVLLPWALGVEVIKVAQALGPFDRLANRAAARLALGRVAWIGLRGPETARNVERLGLRNAEPAADVAFLLEVDGEAEDDAARELTTPGQVVMLIPSAVVEELCRHHSIDYVDRMAQLAKGLTAQGHDVMVVAHSALEQGGGGTIDDLPVCRRIAAASPAVLLEGERDPRHLRALIARSRLLITSRFHAMISGLATNVPTLVVGWSHKYREVMAEFGLEEWVLDLRAMTDDTGLEAAVDLDRRSDEVRARMREALPDVRASAESNIERLVEAVTG
jgi:polysaccharide pyruvyl transferase WcaK-like protein